MKRAIFITVIILTLMSGLVFAVADSATTATDAVNRIFAEFAAPTVDTDGAVAPEVPAAAVTAAEVPATTTAPSLPVEAAKPTAEETILGQNTISDDSLSSHHAVEPWIAISARVAFPKLTVGINPNISNGIFSLHYNETSIDGSVTTPHVANINVSSVTKDGYIDLVGFSGMAQQFSASPELDLTFWNWLTFSWTQLKGSGAATTPLSVSVDGAPNITVMATAQTDLTMDLIGLQFLNWGFLRSKYIDLNLLAGVQLFWPEQYNYNYNLPLPNMTQTDWKGKGRAPFPIGTPYYGLGADIQLGDFTLTGSYSGLAGLESMIANYTNVDLNYYIISADLNYAFTKNISIDAGYRLFNLQPTLQNGFAQKWMSNQNLEGNVIDGYSTLLRAEGPFGGVTVRF